jgi:curli biogenesis system outer membrane secretion channel CsgG
MKTSILLCFLLVPLQVAATDLPTLAIIDFQSAVKTSLVKILPDLISNRLVNEGLFDVVDRDKLDMALREVAFSDSGAVSQDKTIEAGKMIGAQYMLTGKILDISSKKKAFKGYGVNVETTVVRLIANAEIIETATSRKVFSDKVQSEKSMRNTGHISVSDDTAWGEMAGEVADQLVDKILNSKRLQTIAKPVIPSEEVTIMIESSPDNADVEIDGVFYGNTGLPLPVPSGVHTIRVSLPGYVVWEKKVRVVDGTSFHVQLKEKVDQNVNINIRKELQTK